MSDRIFMAVPRVPWHCEHNVDKKECDICGRPNNDAGSSGRERADTGHDKPAGPGSDGSPSGGTGRDANSGSGSGRAAEPGDLIGAWYADDILRLGAAD
jgi:hypothetical protein